MTDVLVSVGELDALHSTISFLTSVIRCGEPMTPDVQQAIDNAHARIEALVTGPTLAQHMARHNAQEDTAHGHPRSGWFG